MSPCHTSGKVKICRFKDHLSLTCGKGVCRRNSILFLPLSTQNRMQNEKKLKIGRERGREGELGVLPSPPPAGVSSSAAENQGCYYYYFFFEKLEILNVYKFIFYFVILF